MQQETQATVDTKTNSGGPAITFIRFKGDISSASSDAVLGTYSRLPADKGGRLVLDFTQVDYINSSGIALIIQLLMQANKTGEGVALFGLTTHFQKVFKMVGIAKYAQICSDEASATAPDQTSL